MDVHFRIGTRFPALEHLTLDNIELPDPNCRAWEDLLVWSSLKTIRFTHASFMPFFPSKVPNLKSLEIWAGCYGFYDYRSYDGYGEVETLTDLLSECYTLEHLRLENFHELIVEEIVDYLPESLESLSLSGVGLDLSDEAIILIGQTCRQLRSLRVPIEYSGIWVI
jgi:hypothetical protein